MAVHHPFRFNRAIVRTPAATAVKGLRAGTGADPSFEGILAEHAAYVAALEAAGLAVTTLEPRDDYPDALFVEDPALVFEDCAIILNPAAATRAGEASLLRPVLGALFEHSLVLPEGHVDGGDVMVMGQEVFIGLSDRTNRTGATALCRLLAQTDRKGIIVETPASVLHLKTACSIINEDSILVTQDLAKAGVFPGYRLVPIPPGEEAGANILRVNQTIIAGSRFPGILDVLARLDADIVTLENSEIEKIDAGFTCMSLRWLQH